ncbi:MAG: hypothetical protein J6W63_07750 [Treponema sp.]|nr:hypothetical protein [Treponema sp.]
MSFLIQLLALSFLFLLSIFVISLLYIVGIYTISRLVKKGIAGLFYTTTHVVTGEFFLNHMPNGGSSVILRTCFTGTIISFMVIGFYCLIYRNLQCPFEVVKHNGWQFCGIYAATYASFYARFVSQWTYLSNLYNQIKEAELNVLVNGNKKEANDALCRWMAGFIEDAETLHLETKTIFATVIINWSIKYPKVHEFYNDYNSQAIFEGDERKDKLDLLIKKIRKRQDSNRNKIS